MQASSSPSKNPSLRQRTARPSVISQISPNSRARLRRFAFTRLRRRSCAETIARSTWQYFAHQASSAHSRPQATRVLLGSSESFSCFKNDFFDFMRTAYHNAPAKGNRKMRLRCGLNLVEWNRRGNSGRCQLLQPITVAYDKATVTWETMLSGYGKLCYRDMGNYPHNTKRLVPQGDYYFGSIQTVPPAISKVQPVCSQAFVNTSQKVTISYDPCPSGIGVSDCGERGGKTLFAALPLQ